MNILKNAVDTIQVGLEDYKNSDPRRCLSAVRNISSGILLLFKEKLRQLSPRDSDEVLIKSIILPTSKNDDGKIEFLGKGNKTVDVQQIKARFESLNIKIDWKTLNEINELRNNIEHYYTEKSTSVIIEIISKSFVLIRDFCVKYLDEDPVVLFGQDAWSVFLEAEEIYSNEKDICTKSLSEIDWGYSVLEDGLSAMRCPECQSDLIMGDGDKKYDPGKRMLLACRKCQNSFDFEEVVELCIHEALWTDSFLAIKDGGEPPYDTCPECLKETYIHEEGCCLACGDGQEEKQCAVCGTPLDLEEAHDGNLCVYHSRGAEKDDD